MPFGETARMLPLGSPRWAELGHAYGYASDIPPLLRRLRESPPPGESSEVWRELWSALAHQGDVYPASFAAVPHVVAALARDPAGADADYLKFPAWVEVCRQRRSVEVPADLSPAYFDALAELPSLVVAASPREWDDNYVAVALAALAAAKGSVAVAEAALELTPDVATEFMQWFHSRPR
jgi:hypothetical protein